MTLSFLFDVESDAAMADVGASHRDCRQMIEHRVGVLLNGLLLIGTLVDLPFALSRSVGGQRLTGVRSRRPDRS
jgi:hypothetical protein